MSSPKLQRDVNAIHHKATCRRLVELVSQEVFNFGRVKEDLQEADPMMKAVTQSHIAHIQSVQSDSLTSDDTTQWIQAIEDQHNATKYQAEEKLEDMGA